MINKKESAFNWDNIQFLGLFLSAVIIVYFTPIILSRIFFLVLLVFIYFSKKDYLWIAFLFILYDAPGRLFSSFSGGDEGLGYANYTKSLPTFELGGVGISFLDVFMFFLLIKALKSGKPFNFIFRKDVIFLLIYFVIVVFYSFIFGIQARNIIYTIRKLMPWVLIFFVVKKFSYDDFAKFDRLIFPFVFLAFASQIHTFITGHYLIDFFTSSTSVRADALIWSEEGGYRAGDSAAILLYSLHKGFFYYFSKEKKFSDKYTILIIYLSILSIFLTATRGWIIAVLIVTSLTLFQNSNRVNFSRVFSILVFGILFIFILLLVFPGFDNQASFVIDRVLTVTDVAKGDYSAGGTLSRITDRTPVVMNEFYKSPIFGFGFSQKFYFFADQHVGHPTMLLNVGIVGFIIFTVIFFKWLYYLAKIAKNKMIQAAYGNAALVFSSSLIFFYIVHSSSVSSWGFYSNASSIVPLCLLLSSFNAIILHQINLKKTANS